MIFEKYAGLYDLFYQQRKDYPAEAHFVEERLRSFGLPTGPLLDLGCGTGAHDILLAHFGYSVDGIDASPYMIAAAREKCRAQPDSIQRRLTFAAADIIGFRPSCRYAAVVSLFHVINYLTSNQAVLALFETARAALIPGGLFLVEYWYGPAVLAQRPQQRDTKGENPELAFTRTATPTLDCARNAVRIAYDIQLTNKNTGMNDRFFETHEMRYLFLPEIELFASLSGFKMIDCAEWMGARPPSEATWSCYSVFRAET
jgi:SAM-dependent methyltransferase